MKYILVSIFLSVSFFFNGTSMADKYGVEGMREIEISLAGVRTTINGVPLDEINKEAAKKMEDSFGESELLDALEKKVVREAFKVKDVSLAAQALYVGTLIASSSSASFYNLLTDQGIFEEHPSRDTIKKVLEKSWALKS